MWNDLRANNAANKVFLGPMENHVLAERCSGFLGALATIFRQRETYAECRVLMEG